MIEIGSRSLTNEVNRVVKLCVIFKKEAFVIYSEVA